MTTERIESSDEDENEPKSAKWHIYKGRSESILMSLQTIYLVIPYDIRLESRAAPQLGTIGLTMTRFYVRHPCFYREQHRRCEPDPVRRQRQVFANSGASAILASGSGSDRISLYAGPSSITAGGSRRRSQSVRIRPCQRRQHQSNEGSGLPLFQA
jgi:hypothetical protein